MVCRRLTADLKHMLGLSFDINERKGLPSERLNPNSWAHFYLQSQCACNRTGKFWIAESNAESERMAKPRAFKSELVLLTMYDTAKHLYRNWSFLQFSRAICRRAVVIFRRCSAAGGGNRELESSKRLTGKSALDWTNSQTCSCWSRQCCDWLCIWNLSQRCSPKTKTKINIFDAIFLQI